MKNKIITFLSLKGGVGKTTSVANISAALAKNGKKILIIDTDPIGNLTSNLCSQSTSLYIHHILKKKASIKSAKISISNNIDLIPSSIDLSFYIMESDFEENLKNFREALEKIEKNYDYILIDTSPSWGYLNQLILTISNRVIIPVKCDYFSLESISSILRTIRIVQKKYNKDLNIAGIIINMFDKRLTNHAESLFQISSIFKDSIYNTIIPQDITISKLQSKKKTIIDSEPWKPAGIAYFELANEIISKFLEE